MHKQRAVQPTAAAQLAVGPARRLLRARMRDTRTRACARVCVRACIRASVHACVRACVRAVMLACVLACLRGCMRFYAGVRPLAHLSVCGYVRAWECACTRVCVPNELRRSSSEGSALAQQPAPTNMADSEIIE